MRHTDLSAWANFSHRTAMFKYVQLSTYYTHTVCIFCPHFLTTPLKGQCKFSIATSGHCFLSAQHELGSLHWPPWRLSRPSGDQGSSPQDRPVKGIVQVSDCTKAHCDYLVPNANMSLYPDLNRGCIYPLKGEAGRPPPPPNNHLFMICWCIHGWNSTDKNIYRDVQHSRAFWSPAQFGRKDY